MRIGHASIDENNKAKNGSAGDQTGKEVCIRSYYNKGWKYLLRYPDPKVAEKMAAACESICRNDCVGYDQNQRNTLNRELKKIGYKYEQLTVPCETDCSALMTVCAQCAGIDIFYSNGNAPHTRTMVSAFTDAGFDVKVPPFNQADFRRGDVLVVPGSHTVMVLDNGSNVSEKKSIDAIAKEVIAGKWGTGNDRRQRLTKAGYDYKIIQNRVNELLKKLS